MPQVRVDHEHVVVADAGDTAAALRADVHRHVLAEDVVVADFQAGGLPFVFAILRRPAEDAVRMENILLPDRRMSNDGYAVVQLAARPDVHVGTDDTEWPDLHILGDLC